MAPSAPSASPAHFPAGFDVGRHLLEGTPWQDGPAAGPDEFAIYAIGDVHGRADLLAGLHAAIAIAIRDSGAGLPAVLCYLGDYIDRGPDPRGVIDLARAAAPPGCAKVTLGGNHEAFLTSFLALSVPGLLADWLRNGGFETLDGLGVPLPASVADPEEAEILRGRLREALGPERLAFLSALKPAARFGGYVFAHAGINPDRPLTAQTLSDLQWIRQGFLDHDGPFPDDVAVVHGHSIMAPGVYGRRVAVDGGAFASGRLTAAEIRGPRLRFLTASLRASGAATPRRAAQPAGQGGA